MDHLGISADLLKG